MFVCSSGLLPLVYQFVWEASRTARTSPGVSLSWSFHRAEWPQSPWNTEVRVREQLKTDLSGGVVVNVRERAYVKTWMDGLVVFLLTLQWSRRYKRPGRIWQRVQRWRGTARLQDPPIPRWTDWPENTHKNTKHKLILPLQLYFNPSEGRLNQ